jgi:hypothetical protein
VTSLNNCVLYCRFLIHLPFICRDTCALVSLTCVLAMAADGAHSRHRQKTSRNHGLPALKSEDRCDISPTRTPPAQHPTPSLPSLRHHLILQNSLSCMPPSTPGIRSISHHKENIRNGINRVRELRSMFVQTNWAMLSTSCQH